MKPAKPLPTGPPFLSIYTPYFRRPAALGRLLVSVTAQTAADHVEHLVLPDHAGYGIVGGLYGRMSWYANALRGKYVMVLCDDDELAGETVVAQLMAFAQRHKDPEVIVVKSEKGGLEYPNYPDGAAPESGDADLCSYIVRRDIWLQHLKDYGMRYEGDFDHALALHEAGRQHVRADILMVTGMNQNGRPEY